MAVPTTGRTHRWGAGTDAMTVTESYELLSGQMALQESHLQNDGARGTREQLSDTVVLERQLVQTRAPITFYVNSVELDAWLPRILGTAEATDVFALAETLPAFRITHDWTRKMMHYDGCYVNTATFSSRESQRLQLAMTIIGKTETVAASSFPSVDISVLPPYRHKEAVFTFGGVAYKVEEFELTINNFLIAEPYNSDTAQDIVPADREVTLGVTFRSSADEDALYAQAIAGLTTNTIKFTKGNRSITFTLGALQAPAETDIYRGRRQTNRLRVNWHARAIDGGLASLAVTNDSSG